MLSNTSHEKRLKEEQILLETRNTSTGCTGRNDSMSDVSRKVVAKDEMDCIFCNLLKESEKNKTFITKLDFGSLFLHGNQNYLGRCLYVSNTHVDDFPHIDYELFVNLNREMLLICKGIEKIFQPDLVNFASLGNAIRHFHYHIIPRYNHDSNWGKPPWPSREKKLEKEDFEQLVSTIRRSLEEIGWLTE